MAQMTQLPVAYTPVREVLQPSNEGLLSWLDAICPLDLRFVRMVPIPTAGGLLAAGWYLRFSLSCRDVEERLAERGLHAKHVRI
jgi:hypothetical protein